MICRLVHRPTIFIVTLFLTCIIHTQAGANQSITFKTSDANSSNRNSMGRPYFLMTDQSNDTKRTISPNLKTPFAISTWIRIDKFTSEINQYNSTNPMTIAHLRGPSEDEAAVFRINGKQAELALRSNGKWRSVLSTQHLPKNKWLLITAGYTDNHLLIYINGQLSATRAYHAAEAELNRMTIGASGSRKLHGGIDEIVLHQNFPTSEELLDLAASRGKSFGQPILSTWQPSTKTPIYPTLTVKPSATHYLINGIATQAELLPWSSPSSNQLLVTSHEKLFGYTANLYTPTGQIDVNGLPIYDKGFPVPLQGTNFKQLPKPNGSFDLIAQGGTTPYGNGQLIQYLNTGTLNKPAFNKHRLITVDNKSLALALGHKLLGWNIHDLDGDNIPDLLITGTDSDFLMNYCPFGEHFWDGKPHPNTGPGRGYDIAGNWLGEKMNLRLYWAKGSINKDHFINFGKVRNAFIRDMDFPVQWSSFDPVMTPAAIKLQNKNYILLASDGDRILALSYTCKDNRLSCNTVTPLMQDDKPLVDMHWFNSVVARDIDQDGNAEVIVSGNPGRVVVLKGTAPGHFIEQGSIRMTGGHLAVDTLTTPARGDFNNDNLPDLITGDSSGYLAIWPGTDNPLIYDQPTYLKSSATGNIIHHQAGPTGSIQGPNEARWGYLQPTLGHWDDDDQLDIITNDINAEVYLYTKQSIDTLTPKRFTLKNKPLPAAWRARPIILSSKQYPTPNQTPSLLYLNYDNNLVIGHPESLGSTNLTHTTQLYYTDRQPVMLGGVRGHWGRVKLSVADWDHDGDWDIVWGHNAGVHRYIWQDKNYPRAATPCWLENVGSNAEPIFKRTQIIKDKNGKLITFKTHNASVWPTHLNNNNQLDLLIGAEDGKVYYFMREDLQAP
ncbi:LamG-like jellyroll fold domain-containing protein [Poriferisphaera sp. WC338]|uniref:LamG-like jellyroll fold domain-containing protein n=1 Tax=Poriferisphaera sp. WC338 TaxID=3425129 RepID=UPI003D81B2F1